MDAAAALADLHDVSSHIHGAVVLDEAGDAVAATGSRPTELARAAHGLMRAADELRRAQGRTLVRLRVVTRDGAVYATRGERGWLVAAVAGSAPDTLVFYDLDNCLRGLEKKAGAAA